MVMGTVERLVEEDQREEEEVHREQGDEVGVEEVQRCLLRMGRRSRR
jgi:hypothetical protein